MFGGNRKKRSERQKTRQPIVVESMETRRLMSVTGVHVRLPHHDQGPITETAATAIVTVPATSTSVSPLSASGIHVTLPHHDQGPIPEASLF